MLKRQSWRLATLQAAHLLSDLAHTELSLAQNFQIQAKVDQSFTLLYFSQSEPMIHAADPRNFGAVARLVLPGSLLRSHPLQLMPRSALPGYRPPKGWSTAQVLRLSAWLCRGTRSHVRTASRTSHLYCHCHRRVCEIGVYGCLQPGEDKHESHHELTDQSFSIAPPSPIPLEPRPCVQSFSRDTSK